MRAENEVMGRLAFRTELWLGSGRAQVNDQEITMSDAAPSGLDGPRVAPAAGGPARSLIIFLHGYGSNGEDLISLSQYWRGCCPHAAFVSPNAPQRCPGVADGYQWWAITSLDPGQRGPARPRPRPILQAFIDEELAQHGLDESRIALVGFSQGTMMSLHAAAAARAARWPAWSAIPAWLRTMP